MATILLLAFRSTGRLPRLYLPSKLDMQTGEKGSSHSCTVRRIPPGKGQLGKPIGGGEGRPWLTAASPMGADLKGDLCDDEGDEA